MGQFINFAEIGGKFLNFVEIWRKLGGIYNFFGNRGICNMPHWLRGDGFPCIAPLQDFCSEDQ